MDNLIKELQTRIALTNQEINFIIDHFSPITLPSHTKLIEMGNIADTVFFLDKGIVKGYQNIDGKIIVKDLVPKHNFFTAFNSFTSETISEDTYETITECHLLKITKKDFNFLYEQTKFWAILVNQITNEHLSCKLERVKDFQLLSAKERYLKFLKNYPLLALHVSVDNMASFLGIEPQSLSRIRKQVAF